MLPEWLSDADLVVRYRRFVDEFADQRNVRHGLQLFAAGIGLAVVALVFFLWAFVFADESAAWLEPAYALGLLALPLVMLSIVIFLESDRWMRQAGIAGVAITVLATAGFVLAYPYDWNSHGADYTPYVVSVYALGVAALTVALGVSLQVHAPTLIRTITEIGSPESAGSSPAAPDGSAESGDRSSAAATDDDRSDADGPPIVTLVVDGERYAFADGETFGRREEMWLADLVNASGGHHPVSYVSSEHVAFAERDDGVYAVDLSQNGTALNGRELDGGEAKLSDGDTLDLAGAVEVGVNL